MTRRQLSNYLQTAIAWFFYGLVILTPLLWTSKTSELFEFPKILSVYIFTILITTVWLGRMAVSQQLILKKTPFDLPLIAFLLSQIISTLFSIDPRTSLLGYYSRFHGGLMSTVSYIFLYYAAVSNLNSKHFRYLTFSFVGSAFLSSLYAFPEHFGASPSCALITGDFNVACWVQDVQTRVYGTFGQPNWLAAYLIALFFIPLSWIINSLFHRLTKAVNSSNNHRRPEPAKSMLSSWPTKDLLALISSFLALALFFAVLLFTKSRSGILGLAVGFTVFWLLTFTKTLSVKKPKTSFTPLFLLFTTLSLAFFALYLSFGRGVIPQVDRLISRFSSPDPAAQTQTPAPPPKPATGTQLERGGTESGTIRQIVWTGAWELFKQHPVFGVGVETFAYAYYNVRPAAHNLVSEWDFLYNKAHNEWLNFLATTGLAGFLSYLSIILVFALFILKSVFIPAKDKAANPTYPYFLLALLAGYLALAISNFLGFSTVPVGLVFFLFPALALGSLNRTDSPVEFPETKKAGPTLFVSPAHYIFMGVLSVITLFLILKINTYYRADRAYALGKAYQDQQDLVNSMTYFQEAFRLSPNEPLFSDQLSLTLAQGAAALNQNSQATQAAQLAKQAVLLSDHTLELNSVHLNYLKTRARVFIFLTAIDPKYLNEAQVALEQARHLSPTDPKIIYNLGLLQQQLGNLNQALELFQQSLDLKPNYHDLRFTLAQFFEDQGNIQQAIDQYQYILTRISPNDRVAKENLDRLQSQLQE